MIYSWKEINKKYGHPRKVRVALNRGEIYRVRRGYYSEKQHINPFLLIAAKYPNGIITMDTAFFIHGLTDVIPDNIYLATLRNATRIAEDRVVQVFMSERIFEPGKTTQEYEGVMINIYNRERMLIEALRNSKTMPFDYYKEIIAGYRRIDDKSNVLRHSAQCLFIKKRASCCSARFIPLIPA